MIKAVPDNSELLPDTLLITIVVLLISLLPALLLYFVFRKNQVVFKASIYIFSMISLAYFMFFYNDVVLISRTPHALSAIIISVILYSNTLLKKIAEMRRGKKLADYEDLIDNF